jgi:hypothetical protein
VQFQGVGDQGSSGVEGEAEGCGEGGGGVLVDQRRPGTGQGSGGEAEHPLVLPPSRVLIRARVQQRPLHGQLDLSDGGVVLPDLGFMDTVDHLGGGEGSGGVHGSMLGVSTDTFDKRFEDVENFCDRPGGCVVSTSSTSVGCGRSSATANRGGPTT